MNKVAVWGKKSFGLVMPNALSIRYIVSNPNMCDPECQHASIENFYSKQYINHIYVHNYC